LGSRPYGWDFQAILLIKTNQEKDKP